MKPLVETDVEVTGLAQTGEGVAHVRGRLVLVPGALPGERARVRLDARGTDAELLAIEHAAPERVEPQCAIVDRCGGCTWQHAAAALQRDARLAQLRRALPAAVRDLAVDYTPSPAEYHYRGRARLAWSTHDGKTTLGFRERASHDVVEAARCPVLVGALNAALPAVRDAVTALGGAGELSLACGAAGAPVADLHPALMPTTDGFRVGERLMDHGFAGAALWAPGASAPHVVGDPRPVVGGADGVPLVLGAAGFAQANEGLNTLLAACVARRAAVSGQRVLELYAGAGNFTVLLARAARRVTAVESDAGASAALATNVAARGLTNVAVVHGDAEEAARGAKPDTLVLDPPRTGARAVCESLASEPPRRVVYVSCDAPTLGRDLAILLESMELKSLDAFEMFPQTPHLEVVATLERRPQSRAARARRWP